MLCLILFMLSMFLKMFFSKVVSYSGPLFWSMWSESNCLASTSFSYTVYEWSGPFPKTLCLSGHSSWSGLSWKTQELHRTSSNFSPMPWNDWHKNPKSHPQTRTHCGTIVKWDRVQKTSWIVNVGKWTDCQMPSMQSSKWLVQVS